MKKIIMWIAVAMLLLSSDVFACGNAMMGGKKSLLTLETVISLLLFILPVIIPWLMGKTLFYINKTAQNADSKDRKKLIYFSLVPWLPLLIIGTIIWLVVIEYLLRTFLGYSYSTSTFIALVVVGYLFVTLLIYKIFHLTPFNKKT